MLFDARKYEDGNVHGRDGGLKNCDKKYCGLVLLKKRPPKIPLKAGKN